MKLTRAQREALEKLVMGPCTPWDFGSNDTVNQLQADELAEVYHDRVRVPSASVRITPAGRKALEES